eukprot:RCo043253
MLDMGALVWSAFQAVVRVVHPGPSFRPTAKQAEAALSLTRVVFSFVNALLIMAVVPCVVCFFLHVARVRVFFSAGGAGVEACLSPPPPFRVCVCTALPAVVP